MINDVNWRYIAHRGTPRRNIENTIISFKDAISLGAKFIELDVHLTQDEQLVVFHDFEIKRPIDEKMFKINKLTLEEINSSFLGLSFKVPTLQEVLSLLKNTEVLAYLEIKPNNPLIVEKTIKLAKKLNVKFIISSFEHDNLKISKHISHETNTMALLEWYQTIPINLIKEGVVDQIGVADNWFAYAKMIKAKEFNIPTYVFTVNDKHKMKLLKSKGFNGVFTDTF